MASEAPKWLFPLLEAKFRTARTSNRDRNNYGFFCTTCMGDAIREIDKPDHPGHDILQAVKASHHFTVRVKDMIERLNYDRIATFSINHKKVFFLNSRVDPKKGEKKNVKNKREQNSNGNSNGLAPSKRYCMICAWQLPEGDLTSLYCSLGCKFKSNGFVTNPQQERNRKGKQAEEDENNDEQTMGGDSNQGTSNGETSERKEETEAKMNSSLRKRSRKGIQFDSVTNPQQEEQLEISGKCKQIMEDENNGEQAMVADSDQGRSNGETSERKTEAETKMNTSLRKRSRKGIPVRSPFQ